MPVSVIVSNFNGAKYLPRLLQTLRAQRGVLLEIIVVDRNSTDGSGAELARHPELKLIAEPPETGLAAGYAAGAALARYEHLFFCNEDMWFDADCLRRLEAALDLSRKIACADPWQWSYDGSRLVHAAAQVRRGWNRGSPHPFYSLSQNDRLSGSQRVAQACAGAMLIHRFAYDDIGGWDRSFFLDHEDTDLAIRLWQRGWCSVAVPEARVYHAVGASNTLVIPQGKGTVAKRRYVLGESNRLVLAWKLFSLRLVALPLIGWLERFARNLCKARWRLAGWDLLALKSAVGRVPAVVEFRRRNWAAVRYRPGERFFRDPKVQFGAAEEPPPVIGLRPDGRPLVQLSVALVTRNRPEHLRKCVASWRSQSVQPFEIVVSDDSADDLSDEVSRLCAQFDCRYVKGPRRGLYANRNNAAFACRGTHILTSDDDHTHPAGFVGAILADVECAADDVWAYGEQHPARPQPETPIPAELLPDNRVLPPLDRSCTAAISDGCTVYPRAVFVSGQRYDETYRFGGLWYLWGHQLLRAGFRVRVSTRTFVWHDSDTIYERAGDADWMKHQLECGVYVAFRNCTRNYWTLPGLGRAVKLSLFAVVARRAPSPGLIPVRLSAAAVCRALRNALTAT